MNSLHCNLGHAIQILVTDNNMEAIYEFANWYLSYLSYERYEPSETVILIRGVRFVP